MSFFRYCCQEPHFVPKSCDDSSQLQQCCFYSRILNPSIISVQLLRWLSGKESTCQHRRRGFNPWAGKIPWRRKWELTPVLLPGKFCGQRNLAGYSQWGLKESDATEHIDTHSHIRCPRDLKKKGTFFLQDENTWRIILPKWSLTLTERE